MATNKGYATTQQLADIVGIKMNVPSWETGKTPENESVGQGDDSKTIFYLNQKNILDGTYTIFYGSDKTTTTELTDVTDYVLSLDDGKITLTAGGVTTVGANSIFAKYSYTKNAMSDSYLTEVLNRSEVKVDQRTNATFTDGTVNNPSYPLETEIQPSPGYFRNQIIVEEKPLIDIVSTVDGALDDSQVTIDLAAGTGANFPSTGSIIIDTEVVTYTGITTDQLTGVTRGVMGTTAATHLDAADVHSTILFLSNTQQGVERVYTVQPWGTGMHATENGLFYSYNQSVFQEAQYSDRLSEQDVADRVKLVYYYGYDTIPYDITRLTLIFAKEMLLKDSIGSSLIEGRDEFRPVMTDTDRGESESIINSYIVIPMGNT